MQEFRSTSAPLPDGAVVPPIEASIDLPRRLVLRTTPAHPVAWAVMQPNAPRRGELRGRGSFLTRQQLKANHQYVAERVLIVVGRDEVALWATAGGVVVCRCAGRWPRNDIVVSPATPVGPDDPRWLAFTLVDVRSCRLVAELRSVSEDPAAHTVAAALRA